MGLRMTYRDKSTEDFNEQPEVEFSRPPGPGLLGITKAMKAMNPGYGNVDAMYGAYGPGSPMDPMSGGVGKRYGLGWSQGLGQQAFNPNWAGMGSNPMGYSGGYGSPASPHGGYGTGQYGGWGGFGPGAGNFSGGFGFGAEDPEDSDNYGGSG